MINISEDHYKSIEDIKEKSQQYLNNAIDPVRFKAFRVSMGVYEQRKKETYMVRTRIPGGVITLEQFKRISALAEKYAKGKLKFTSRQDIQFQSVDLKDVYPIINSLIEVCIITKGTGGNTVGNVECSPLSGVSTDDVFDVTPYVKAATNYLIKDPTTMNMPRKYKIAFSNTPEDTGNATISDLGFIAKTAGGKRGFEVYGAGGFGGSPRVAIKLSDFIPADEILYYIQGLKNVFEAEGDRTNKNKARIRFILMRLGEKKFVEELEGEINKLKEFEGASSEIKAALPKLFISGCPNSCAQHEKGALGFHGRAKRTKNGLIPMYSKVGSNTARMGDTYGDVPAKKVPLFIHELAELKVNSGYEDFYDFLDNRSSDIKALISKYTDVDKFIGETDIYFDFGACEKFSLKGRGPGECSSGVMDVIRLDLSNARSSLERYKDTKQNSDLYSSALSSARALLVLKGVDSNKDREIFEEFNKNFIETGYVKSSIKKFFEDLIDYKIDAANNISGKASEVEYLYSKVDAMYKSLNGKLEITLPKEENVQSKPHNEDNGGVNGHDKIGNLKIVNLRGVKCPINFVKVKVELSKIKSGQKLGFYLDDGDPINNVPQSAEKEGHEIIFTDTNYDGYNLLVLQKK